ncbi:protein CBFA2T2 isoform X2 [Eupeodes corollae]|uniref:protein CBFA2T2 isoform X2 n=2 Tax=Eupeodes corollae TaxID=290404 RepID=UPI0024924809|nr:protein CBFA2T2 isoform X2 [Eupeodes corollae]
MMALDGKAIIKEEITDKDAFEATATTNNRRSKGGNACKDKCRTPDSPESARAVAPRSPMSPQIHHSSLAPPPRPNRNSSSSPVVNGATTTPPPPPPSTAHVEQARLLGKIRKFLGSLVQLAQDVHPEASDRVRALVLSFGSGGISIEDFRIALQEAINLPLRPHVIPLLKSHIVLLQREIAALSRATSQTPLQYVTSNENSVMEFSHSPSEYQDIFLQLDSTTSGSVSNGNGLVFKRRSSDSIMDHHNGGQEWNDYMYPAAKRMHTLNPPPNGYIPGQPASSLFEYPGSAASSQGDVGFGGLLDKPTHREDREMRAAESQRVGRMAAGGGEEEWKNIHTMLNCISAMVDKTKRAITILQQRGVDPIQEVSSTAVLDIRRQTEEKVSEFKRNAEEAVNQVKRQAVLEIQRAVAAAESRAAEVMAQERLRMEKFFAEISRNPNERDLDNKSPSVAAGQNACWNCGRKATETCSGCNLARYCGAFCQHKDWEHHHQICGSSRSDITAAKHPSQVIALTANIRGSLARTPPTPSTSTISSQSSQPPSSQSSAASLVPNGSTSATGSK